MIKTAYNIDIRKSCLEVIGNADSKNVQIHTDSTPEIKHLK